MGDVLDVPRRRLHPIHMTRSQLAIAAASLCVLGSWAAATHAIGATADDLRHQLAKERRAHRIEVRTLRGQLRHHPDFQVSLQLAGIVYRQDWRHLEACALSEGARRAERYTRYNARPNSQGSGATGAFQFMRGTFLSTPFAGLDWTRQDVQAFAAAWMWEKGRRTEWAGAGC